MFEAKVIADSICESNRLTTIQMTGWVALQAEVNTHSAFAKNASSSRAIPIKKMLERVEAEPFIPIYWGKATRGMSPVEEIDNKEEAVRLWLEARDKIVEIVRKLDALGLHKQSPNRLLAPFSWITTAITGDDDGWCNFFAQRCHPDAQQEFQHPAYLAQKAYFESTPFIKKEGEWHLPYVMPEERDQNIEDLIKLSTGRTARTSYLSQEGKRENQKDFELHDRLVESNPKHLSPLEQVAFASPNAPKNGKFKGWTSYRKLIPNEFITEFEPNYKEYFGE